MTFQQAVLKHGVLVQQAVALLTRRIQLAFSLKLSLVERQLLTLILMTALREVVKQRPVLENGLVL